jgi:hypothetical protein
MRTRNFLSRGAPTIDGLEIERAGDPSLVDRRRQRLGAGDPDQRQAARRRNSTFRPTGDMVTP